MRDAYTYEKKVQFVVIYVISLYIFKFNLYFLIFKKKTFIRTARNRRMLIMIGTKRKQKTLYMKIKIYSKYFVIFQQDLFSLYIVDWFRVNYDTYENMVEYLKRKLSER